MESGFQESLEFFKRQFPGCFNDKNYLGSLSKSLTTARGERRYKDKACELFQETLGDSEAKRLLASKDLPQIRSRLLAVDGKLNLLSPYEKVALRDSFKSDSHTLAFFQALLEVLQAADVSEQTFGKLIRAVDQLPADRGRVATWPVLTLFPYVAQPHRHIFLKPRVTKKFAERLSFDLEYRPEINWVTYSKLLIMSKRLLDLLSPYGARDFLDVQSFIWVVEYYKDTGTRG